MTTAKPDFMPAADEMVYAPTADLLAPAVKSNPPRKKKASKWDVEPFELYDGHEGLLVRCMLVRSQAHAGEREPVTIQSPADVLKLCQHLTQSDQEHLVVLAMNRQNQVNAIYEVAIGHATGTMAIAADILKVPLLTGCLALILVHNHPGGTPTPSNADQQMTDKLKRGADCIGLTLLDHIIVTRNGHFSFVDHGLAP
jgi:DNA repair protein RadC